MKKVLLFYLTAILCSCSSDNCFNELDHCLDIGTVYEQQFNNRLDSLKNELQNCPESDKWECSRQLFNGYVHYKLDSCSRYILSMCELAGNDPERIIISQLSLVKLLHRKNCHHDALGVFEHIDTSGISRNALILYCNTGFKIYKHLSTHTIGESIYLNKKVEMAEIAWATDSTAIESIENKVDILNDEGRHRESIELLHFFSKLLTDESEKARLNYILGNTYLLLGDFDNAKPYLIESSCIDIKLAIKNNTALYLLSQILYEQGDTKRSSRFLKQTIDNNQFCNYEALIIRNSKLNHLVSATIEQQNKTRRHLAYALIFLGALFTTTLTILLLKLRTFNVRLKQASRNKNVLISKFMELSTEYIYGVDNMKSSLRKTAKEEGVDALMKLLRTAPYADSEFNNFKKKFDDFFLWLYPDFIEDINGLMQPSHCIKVPEKGLSTELRMLALIWLGITDRQKISRILHLSIQSVYTYHSLLQNNSRYPNQGFDEAIRKLEAL